MPEIATQLKNNLRERVGAIPVLVTRPMDTVIESFGKLVAMEPVKAAMYLLEHAGDGVVSFVNTQADITKRWIG